SRTISGEARDPRPLPSVLSRRRSRAAAALCGVSPAWRCRVTARPVRIERADDPRIAAYRDIRERDLAGRDGLFVAEGKVVLNVLFSTQRFEPLSALILEQRLAGMQETLALAPPDMPVYVAPQPVMDEITGFHIHRGVL